MNVKSSKESIMKRLKSVLLVHIQKKAWKYWLEYIFVVVVGSHPYKK